MDKKNLGIILIISALLLSVAGCSSFKPPLAASTVSKTAYSGADDAYVNGYIPKGKVGGSYKTILEQTDSQGITHKVIQISRKAGYRSAVHYMNYAITSCVNQGQALMELDDGTLETYKTGECFIMPAGIKGYIANANTKSVLKLTDYTAIPEGAVSMVTLEK